MKKIIFGLIIIVMCFTLTGCFLDGTVEGNEEFGEYTGIYKLKNFELRVVQNGNTLSLIMNKDEKPFGRTLVYLTGNKFEDINCEFELKENVISIKTTQKDIPEGDYKRLKPYTTEEIYKEYIGDFSYLNKNNGVYENDNNRIYTVRATKDTIRMAYRRQELTANIALGMNNENSFSADLYDNKYDINYKNDTLELKADSKDETIRSLTGKYTRKGKMTATEVIKIFVFEEYRDK